MLYQGLSILGSIGILAAFGASQFKLIRPTSLSYLALNAAASGLLGVVAFVERQWGFLLLEGAWSLISLVMVVRVLIRGEDTQATLH